MKKTALVTGSSGGIGLELAKLLAKNNTNLVLVDIRESELIQAAQLLKALSPAIQVDCFVQDLSQPNAAQQIADHPLVLGKAIDILINNAGFGTFGLFSETDWEKESRMIHLHILTLTHLTKLLIPGMVQRGYGKILNVSSVAGFQPSPLMAVYNASKAYVLSFSEAIANELNGTGVTVTVLCPGLTPTGFQETVGVGKPAMTSNKWISSSAEEVAQYGLNALFKGTTVAIPGTINYLLANANRFLPRNTVTQLVRKVQEKNRSFLKK